MDSPDSNACNEGSQFPVWIVDIDNLYYDRWALMAACDRLDGTFTPTHIDELLGRETLVGRIYM
jgi:hypothetical protein